MIESYWGLEFNPFQDLQSDGWYYESPMHEETLARMFFLIEQRHKCGILTGEPGTGKTLLLSMLKRQALRTQRQVASIDAYGIDGHELLWKTLGELGLGNYSRAGRNDLWRGLSDHFHGSALSRQQVVLIFDHLPHASEDAVGFVERMMHLPACTRGWVTTILSARTSEVAELPAGIRSLSDLVIRLKPLNEQHTAEYVRAALKGAGAKKSMFSKAALKQLYEATQGIPRRINQYCNLALMSGMTEQQQTIDPKSFEAAADELALPV